MQTESEEQYEQLGIKSVQFLHINNDTSNIDTNKFLNYKK